VYASLLVINKLSGITKANRTSLYKSGTATMLGPPGQGSSSNAILRSRIRAYTVVPERW
jgi:hypothetical protein